jgi:hypothetical protein
MSDPDNPTPPEPKIVIDNDWKEQVAREKQAASQQAASQQAASQQAAVPPAPAHGSTAPPKDSPVTAAGKRGGAELPPPPPTFELLVSMLFAQAMSMLGQMGDPDSDKSSVNKPYAKHTIDTLDMLGEKTKGNLNEHEAKILSEALHVLRMTYVNTRA